MSDDTPTPADDTPPPAPTLRRICCVAAPRRRAPSLADQLRAAAVWAQLFQQTAAAREQAPEEAGEASEPAVP